MAAFGAADWLAAHDQLCADLPEVPGVSVRAEFVVAGAPDGEARFGVTFADGRLVSSSIGSAADGDVDVSLTMPYATALAVLDGDVDLDVAFMRGDVKPTGHTGRLFDLLVLQRSEPGRAVLAGLAGQTDR